jgi:hypothetical protein
MSTFENHIRDIVREELAQTDEFLTTTEAAEVLGVTPSWLHHARHFKSPEQPPYHRFDRAIRYKRADLIAWIEASRREVAS